MSTAAGDISTSNGLPVASTSPSSPVLACQSTRQEGIGIVPPVPEFRKPDEMVEANCLKFSIGWINPESALF